MTRKLLNSVGFLGLIIAASPAHAFDESNWNWNYDVTQTADISYTVESAVSPTGNIAVENLQTFNGDIAARTEFYGELSDNQTGELPESITIQTETDVDGDFTFSGSYDANAESGNVNDDAVLTSDMDNFDGSVTLNDDSTITVQPSNYVFNGTINGTVTGEQEVDLSEYLDEASPLDASTDMASVKGAATAIANYRSLESETATYLDESQVHNATNASGWGVEASAVAGTEEDPIEGAVDLSATAISNYMSIQGSVEDPNNVSIADLNQETNANVLASAISYQDLTDYNNLGNYAGLGEDVPMGTVANLSATAIGNYSSFNFGPSVDLGPVDDENSE